jgi:chromosome segregation ATPase
LRRKLTVWLIVVHFLAAMSIQAQVLPSVDIDTAQTQIDQFLRENELLQERIELLVTTNSELGENAILWQSWIAGIGTVSERLVDRASQLIDILNELASKSVMERAQTVLDRYYDLKAILDEKELELAERQQAAEASIERNTTVGADLKKKIESNLENVELLKAAIERSAGSEETVNAYIESLEEAIEDAEGALRSLF